MNNLTRKIPLIILLILALTACGGGDEGNSAEILTQAAQIAMDGLTQTAAALPPTATDTPLPTATDTPEPSPTTKPTKKSDKATATNTQQSAQTGGGNRPCWRGNLEVETVLDGSDISTEKVFTKTWRLKNTGSCTWPVDTVAFWVKGDLMGAKSVQPITEVEIRPNEYVEIAIDFLTPDEVGTYKSYWMLRGGGAIFGIGQKGLSWFWVEIDTYIDKD